MGRSAKRARKEPDSDTEDSKESLKTARHKNVDEAIRRELSLRPGDNLGAFDPCARGPCGQQNQLGSHQLLAYILACARPGAKPEETWKVDKKLRDNHGHTGRLADAEVHYAENEYRDAVHRNPKVAAGVFTTYMPGDKMNRVLLVARRDDLKRCGGMLDQTAKLGKKIKRALGEAKVAQYFNAAWLIQNSGWFILSSLPGVGYVIHEGSFILMAVAEAYLWGRSHRKQVAAAKQLMAVTAAAPSPANADKRKKNQSVSRAFGPRMATWA